MYSALYAVSILLETAYQSDAPEPLWTAVSASCFVLISQDRQSAKDRVRSDIEYEVNIKAELEVAHLHEKTDRIHEEMLDRFMRIEKALGVAPVRKPATDDI